MRFASGKHGAVAAAQALLGVLLLGGVWVGLPARWPWVDVPGSALGAAALLVAAGLFARLPWAQRVARIVLWSELVIGSALVTLLAMSAAQLAGSYGPVGGGGALLMLTIAALVLPYLIAWPALQLWWMRESR